MKTQLSPTFMSANEQLPDEIIALDSGDLVFGSLWRKCENKSSTALHPNINVTQNSEFLVKKHSSDALARHHQIYFGSFLHIYRRQVQ